MSFQGLEEFDNTLGASVDVFYNNVLKVLKAEGDLSSSNDDEMMSHISVLLGNPVTRTEGLLLLSSALDSSGRRIVDKAHTFIPLCLNALKSPSEQCLAYSVIKQILEMYSTLHELERSSINSHIPDIMQSLAKCSPESKISALLMLESLLAKYSKSCGPHKIVIEMFLVPLVDNRYKNLVTHAAKCAHLLQQIRSVREQGINQKTAWMNQFNLLIKSITKMMSILYSVDLQDDEEQMNADPNVGPLQSCLEKLDDIISDDSHTCNPITIRALRVSIRLENLFIFLQAMIVEPFPVPKKFNCRLIFDILMKCHSAVCGTHCACKTEPFLHSAIINTLRALCMSLKGDILPYSSLIIRMILQSLEWSKIGNANDSSSKPFKNLRKTAYCALSSLLKCIHSCKPPVLSGDLNIEDALLENTLGDICPKANMTNIGGSKSLAVYAQGAPDNVRQLQKRIQWNESNMELTAAAIDCLHAIYTCMGNFLKPNSHKLVQESIVELMYNKETPLQIKTKLSPVLSAMVNFTNASQPSVIAHSINLHSIMQHNTNHNLSWISKCALSSHLSSVRGHVSPLNFPPVATVSNSVKHNFPPVATVSNHVKHNLNNSRSGNNENSFAYDAEKYDVIEVGVIHSSPDASQDNMNDETTLEIQEPNMEIQTRKRHLRDDSNLLKAKIAKESENIIQTKVQSDSENWELNTKLKISDENNESLKINLQKLRVENERLIATNQNLISSMASIRHKFEIIRKLSDDIGKHLNITLEFLKEIENEKKNIMVAYKRNEKKIEEFKSKVNVLKEEYSKQLLTIQQKVDEKCNRIAELNYTLSLTNFLYKDANSVVNTLMANNYFLINQVRESINKSSALQDKINRLEVESSQKTYQLASELAEAEKQCYVRQVALNLMSYDLSLETIHINELTQKSEDLKDELIALETKNKEQESTCENKVTDVVIEQQRLLKANESLQQEMEINKQKHIEVVETQTKQIAELEAGFNNLSMTYDSMKEVKKSIKEQLNGKLNELEMFESVLQGVIIDKQKLQDDMRTQDEKNKANIERLRDLILEKRRESEARQMKLTKKLELLQNRQLVQAEKYTQLKNECNQNDIMSKKYKGLEQKYNCFVKKHEKTKRINKNTRATKNKETSSSDGRSVDKRLPATDKTKNKTVCQIPSAPIRRNESAEPKRNVFYSDSDSDMDKETNSSAGSSVDKRLPATDKTKNKTVCQIPSAPIRRNESPEPKRNVFYSDSDTNKETSSSAGSSVDKRLPATDKTKDKTVCQIPSAPIRRNDSPEPKRNVFYSDSDKETSSSAGSSVDKRLPVNDKTKDKTVCQIPSAPIRRNDSPERKRNVFYSDSENSEDSSTYDLRRIMQRRIAKLTKEEREAIANRRVFKF